MTKVFDLVPGWAYALAVALLAALVVVQESRIDGLRVDIAKAEAAAAKLETERERVAAAHAVEKLELLDRHSAELRKADDDYAQKLAAAEVRARADAATVGRLRDQIAAFSRGGGTCQTTTAVADGGKPAAEVLGGLLAESLELLAEGRRLHEDRDAEMSLLFAQLDADRAACQGVKRVTTAPSN